MTNTVQIIPIELGNVHAYLVTEGEQAVLIDTGKKGNANIIADIIQQQGLALNMLKLIILTHTHYDHAGSAHEIQKLTGAQIVVQENEAICLKNGFCNFPTPTISLLKPLALLEKSFLKKMGRYDPAQPEIIVKDELDLKPFGFSGRIIATPGHSTGSQSVIFDKSAIVGDTMFGIFPTTVFPPFADDARMILRSWEKLLALECTQFFPGHGLPFSRNKLLRNYHRHSKILK